MKTFKLRAAIVSCVGALALAGSASASYIQGEVIFGGVSSATGGNSPQTMTGISFINPVVLVAGIGDYSAMNTGDDVVMTDFVFGAPGNLTTTPPVSFTLWSQANTGWYFQLDSLMINEITTAGDRELGGFGTVYAPGFKPTSAKWDLRSTGTTKTFFYVSDTTSVPDGGTSMALLGLSLVSLPLLRKTLMR